jgi:hypothetical protein
LPSDANSRSWLWVLLWGGLFALAHTQAPYFYSNQNQYLLHGMAEGGHGYLIYDWQSMTKDPTPVFSLFIELANRHVGPIVFQVVYFVLLMIFGESLRRLVVSLPGFQLSGFAQALFLLLLLLSFAAWPRIGSVKAFGADYPWFLQAGLAGQYILGPAIQPSAFGVLLIVSLLLFIQQRPITAAAVAALTADIHSTYLMHSGALVLGYQLSLALERRWRDALYAGLLALALVLPVMAYNYLTFKPSEHFQEAQEILARTRIPHHTLVERWFNWVAGVQLGVMALGLLLVCRTRLFIPLLVPTTLGVALSAVQIKTQSDTLSLLFPWRFSVVLMPIATAVIWAKLAKGIGALVGNAPNLSVICYGLIVAMAVSSPMIYQKKLGYAVNEAEEALLNYIRDHKQPDDLYLIPTRLPKLSSAPPGAVSTTFTPPPRAKPDAKLIPVDLQRFRLYTGAPIYVDFKSIPYQEGDVLEWLERMKRAQGWYDSKDWQAEDLIGTFRSLGITHVVVTADREVKDASLELLYSDESYRLYRIKDE